MSEAKTFKGKALSSLPVFQYLRCRHFAGGGEKHDHFCEGFQCEDAVFGQLDAACDESLMVFLEVDEEAVHSFS